jgi:flagellin-like protein
MTRPLNDQGVSVIIGTLLLILITVVAATSLAVLVSQMQNNYAKQQQHLAKVNSENISIQNVIFYDNQTKWANEWGLPNSQYWSSVNFTLVNMNTNDSIVEGIAINDNWAVNFTDDAGNIYNVTNQSYLTVPAESYKRIYVNFVANSSPEDPTIDFPAPPNFSVSTQQKIEVVTALSNTFQRTIRPPNPVYQMSIESDNIGTTPRDVLVLDGSGSTADNPIIWWNWTIYDEGLPQVNGAWPNQTFSGKTVRITTLNNTPNIPDPYTPKYFGTLTVTDSVGLTQTSLPFSIPPDPQFDPPANLNVQYTDPKTVPDMFNVTVRDVDGKELHNVLVNFQIGNNPYNNLMIQPFFNYTDPSGNISVIVTGGNGTVNVLCGKLPSAQVSVCSNTTTPAVICPIYS